MPRNRAESPVEPRAATVTRLHTPAPPAAPMAALFVPGVPQPQGSTRSFVHRKTGRIVTTTTNDELYGWRSLVADLARAHIGPVIPYPDGPVGLILNFRMPRRAAEPKRVTPAHTRRPDLDKLTRAILDALTGLLYADDAQVTFFACGKATAAIGEQPGAHISWSRP